MPFCMTTSIQLTIPQGTKVMLTLEGNLILWFRIQQSHMTFLQGAEWVYIGMNLTVGFSHLRAFTGTGS